ncbi:amidohydrolase family protein, partial [Streptococcus hyovaginalis]
MVEIIDTHAHLWSDDYLKRLEDLGAQGVAIAKGMGAGSSPEELEKRFTMMDQAGVDVQVLSATPQSPQFGNPEEALLSAQLINDHYKDLIHAYPQRFKAYGAVPLPYVD